MSQENLKQSHYHKVYQARRVNPVSLVSSWHDSWLTIYHRPRLGLRPMENDFTFQTGLFVFTWAGMRGVLIYSSRHFRPGIRYCFGYKESCTFTITSPPLHQNYLSAIQVRIEGLYNTSLMLISTALLCLDRLDIPWQLKGLLSRHYLVL